MISMTYNQLVPNLSLKYPFNGFTNIHSYTLDLPNTNTSSQVYGAI